ncbi:hypothetical protein ABTH99_09380 [Acinetobacter baumannii]|uniref:hypothetical protein n=1 Tax=Acinetobacter baumannii TaxID=470 RepID=UPI000D655D8C|nr:hypothetical protein [Acinetobacter baumannii]MDN8175562.1 hypothetical protein [Acinetobacter baumannii]HEE5839793.1 hypothetical protein [Acinetobacter baumannii]
MKVNLNKLFIFLSFSPMFFPNKPFLLIFLLPSLFYFIAKGGYKLFALISFSVTIGLLFFLRDCLLGYIDYSSLKIIYFFVSLFLAWDLYKKRLIDLLIVRKIFILYTVVNFIIILLQFLTPHLFVWSYIVESEGQYLPFLDGRMFGMSGNPTHSGYLTMLVTFLLISLRVNILYIVLSFISVVLLLNKMSILVLLSLGVLFYLFVVEKIMIKTSILIGGGVASFFIIVGVIMPYVQRWAEVGYDTHTITYRLDIYNYILSEFKKNNYLVFGDVDIYRMISVDAFDSLPALVIVKFGIFIFFIIYFLIFILTPKGVMNFILYLSLVIPSFTMVGFYNTLYIFPIFLLYFSAILAIKRRKNEVSTCYSLS